MYHSASSGETAAILAYYNCTREGTGTVTVWWWLQLPSVARGLDVWVVSDLFACAGNIEKGGDYPFQVRTLNANEIRAQTLVRQKISHENSLA